MRSLVRFQYEAAHPYITSSRCCDVTFDFVSCVSFECATLRAGPPNRRISNSLVGSVVKRITSNSNDEITGSIPVRGMEGSSKKTVIIFLVRSRRRGRWLTAVDKICKVG
jgi:hypothetical protein